MSEPLIEGVENALSILGMARTFDAHEAVRIGFVQQIAADTDMAALVRSASRPQIKARIKEYQRG